MKRMIKSSFGYSDQDWVNPDPEEKEPREYTLTLSEPNIVITTDDDGYISQDSYDQISFEDYDLSNPDYDFDVITPREAEEIFGDALENSEYNGRLDPNSKYRLDGNVYIDYSVWVDNKLGRARRYYRRDFGPSVTKEDLEIDDISNDFSFGVLQ